MSALSPVIDAAADAVLDGAGGRIYVHTHTRGSSRALQIAGFWRDSYECAVHSSPTGPDRSNLSPSTRSAGPKCLSHRP